MTERFFTKATFNSSTFKRPRSIPTRLSRQFFEPGFAEIHYSVSSVSALLTPIPYTSLYPIKLSIGRGKFVQMRNSNENLRDIFYDIIIKLTRTILQINIRFRHDDL